MPTTNCHPTAKGRKHGTHWPGLPHPSPFDHSHPISNELQLLSHSLYIMMMRDSEVKIMWVVVAVAAVFLVCMSSINKVEAQPQVPCYFIFGDSLVDNGNNNRMASLARANYLPYGIDFPSGPTGRFCNGKTTTDVIAELLGFDDYIPPYASTRGRAILGGVNFASAAAGIRDETGRTNKYEWTDEDSAADYLSRCIYTVGMGSNDYLNNYFMTAYYTTSRRYTPQQYADVLAQQYSQQPRTLYNYGARKVAVIGVGQVGCSPNELAQNSANGVQCVQKINDANDMFNVRLRSLVDNFNRNLAGAKFIYINAAGVFNDILTNPSRYGCCGVGKNNGEITCLPYQTPCQNRDEYVFWDAFHPSEAANLIIGRRAYAAESPSDAYPYDIRQLAQV
ncbi:hypothetical protein C5167_039621 [Papaver somniferum]|uniref:GDSL esterase/lipase n=1 Tax=Papaver somniferum TaxID=3469 RepID=A0A4Y7IG52_PAPSO|nr:hypothetical protein C5167_039621 [Papaver somniferum]